MEERNSKSVNHRMALPPFSKILARSRSPRAICQRLDSLGLRVVTKRKFFILSIHQLPRLRAAEPVQSARASVPATWEGRDGCQENQPAHPL